MGEVTGYTAQRMKEIEDSTVVNGEIDEDNHLQLIRRDLTPIDAGPLGNNPLRNTYAYFFGNNPIIEAGRMAIVTDGNPAGFVIGDGVTPFNSLPQYIQNIPPVRTQQTVTGGTTSGGNAYLLATIVVPNQTRPYRIRAIAMLTHQNSVPADDIEMYITAGGTIIGRCRVNQPEVGNDMVSSVIPDSELYVYDGLTRTVTFHIQRMSGTGSITVYADHAMSRLITYVGL